jgi:hypothetical protein
MEGGCLCGAVRYRLASAPFDTGWCHCRVCQKASGAPALVFTSVPRGDFLIDRGADALGSVRSTEFGRRGFCTRCGTPLTIEVDFQPDTIDLTVASLDTPAAVAPGFHIFYASRIAWAPAADDAPRHDRFRRDTRGLTPGEEP